MATAQTVTIDGGSTSAGGPMGNAANHAGEYLYLASEIAQDLTINKISFHNSIIGTTGPNANYTTVQLYLKTVPLATTTLPTAAYAGTGTYTLVYSGPMNWTKSGRGQCCGGRHT